MNYQLATVASVTTLAFFAHVFGGIPQSLTAEPAKFVDKARTNNLEIPQRHWAQLMCAFQLVTVDLLTLSVLLFLLAFTEAFVQKQIIGFLLSALYFLWGCAWLVQLFFEATSKRLPNAWAMDLLVWLFCPYLLGLARIVKRTPLRIFLVH